MVLLVIRLLHICLQLLHECSTELLLQEFYETLHVDMRMLLVKRLLFVGVVKCIRVHTYSYWGVTILRHTANDIVRVRCMRCYLQLLLLHR